MKFLKFLFLFVIGLFLFVLFAFLMGHLKPEISYGHEIAVNKSIEEAWAVHQDETKYDQWLDGFKSIELLSGVKGTVGSTYKIIVKPEEGQPDFEMFETLESIKEADHITLNMDSEMMVFDQTTSFSEKDGKTIIKTESKVSGKGRMMRAMFAVMDLFTDSFQKKEVENIENLKKVIENNTTNYFPTPAEILE